MKENMEYFISIHKKLTNSNISIFCDVTFGFYHCLISFRHRKSTILWNAIICCQTSCMVEVFVCICYCLRCSIGLKSGDSDGHSSIFKFLIRNHFLIILYVFGIVDLLKYPTMWHHFLGKWKHLD